jgi:hypothetical protein
LLFYAKSDEFTWNKEAAVTEHKPKYLRTKYRYDDDRGTYRLVVLTGSGTTRRGESGRPWRGYDPTTAGRHWAVPGDAIEVLRRDGVEIPKGVLNRLEVLFQHGLVRFPEKSDGEKGVPEYKRYLQQGKAAIQDVITDIPPVNSQAKERTGYPTQKPLALLERIIQASSNEGDMVFDPFCGCGTAILAAQHLKRRWIGIDITHVAVSVLRRRLEAEGFSDVDLRRIYGEPQDFKSAKTLALAKPHGRFEFQAWMVDTVGGIPVDARDDPRVAKRGGDGGIDGWLLFRDDPKSARSNHMVLSVKSDVSPGHEMVRELIGTVATTKATAGALLLLHKPTPGMRSAAKAAGTYSSELYNPDKRHDKIQILCVADIFKGKELTYPGWNSTRRSIPPMGVAGSSGDLFEWAAARPPAKAKPRGKGVKKAKYPEQIDEKVLRAAEKTTKRRK